MQRDENNVAIRVLDKEFLISCPEGARAELTASARLLDQRMREIKAGGRVYGLDRIAVMAALNLSHELLQARKELDEMRQRTRELDARISDILPDSE